MIKQIQIMLDLQEAMNTKVDPNWRTAGNEWYRAIYMECAEMMDHTDWKWWSKKEENDEQIQLEAVDILHFMLAISLLNNETPDSIALAFNSGVEYQKVQTAIDALAFNQMAEMNNKACYNNLASVIAKVGLNFNELFKLYCAKNVLNVFRQDNGYKEGTYTKEWHTEHGLMEDNEVLSLLLNKYDGTEDNFMEELRKDLQLTYK